MLTVFFARHGETIWNTERRMQGRLDTELTERGIAQARALGRQLYGQPLGQILVSPAPRAFRTAQLASHAGQFPAGLPILIEEKIQEMDLGDWEGLSLDEVEQLAPDNLQAFLARPLDYVPTGQGETYLQVAERIRKFLAGLEQQAIQDSHFANTVSTIRPILLISHNITLKTMMALMRLRPVARLREGPPLLQAALYQADFEHGAWTITEPAESKEMHP
jgi:probable phosphoglycerate mutase